MPVAPAANINDPIEAAWPTHKVDTFGLMYCIVSYTPRPAVTKPPGLLI